MGNDEVRHLLHSPDKSDFPEYRDYIAIMLMLDSGTRLGEILSIEMEQLDLIARCVHLPAHQTKGRKARTVHFSSRKPRYHRYGMAAFSSGSMA